MISVQLRQALLQLMWDGGYQAIDAGRPVERSTLDAMQRLVRQEPLEGEPPVPTPTASPLDRFRQRERVGQNCAWAQIDGLETAVLESVYGPIVHTYAQFYAGGGSGGMNVQERHQVPGDPPSVSGYVFAGASGTWEPDVNGAADAYVATLATAQGRTVPGPLV